MKRVASLLVSLILAFVLGRGQDRIGGGDQV